MNNHKEQEVFPAWVRPLDISSADHDEKYINMPEVGFEHQFIKEIYGTGDDWEEDIKIRIRKRYKELSENKEYFVAPTEENFLNKIIWPLRQAKIAYSMSHNIGCIALCGMVCEMTAILIYEFLPESYLLKLDDINVNGKGKKFTEYEKMGQEERVKKLKILFKQKDLLSNEDKQWAQELFEKINDRKFTNNLHNVRNIRKKYLHYLSKEYSNLNKDAKEAYMSTFNVINHIFPIYFGTGSVSFPSYFNVYLRRKGILKKSETNENG
jgi:hypothetical protein